MPHIPVTGSPSRGDDDGTGRVTKPAAGVQGLRLLAYPFLLLGSDGSENSPWSERRQALSFIAAGQSNAANVNPICKATSGEALTWISSVTAMTSRVADVSCSVPPRVSKAALPNIRKRLPRATGP